MSLRRDPSSSRKENEIELWQASGFLAVSQYRSPKENEVLEDVVLGQLRAESRGRREGRKYGVTHSRDRLRQS